MNQTFSLPRFARLHHWLWATKRQTYLISAATLVILSTLFLARMILQTRIEFDDDYQRMNLPIFWFVGLVSLGALASDVFSHVYRQESAISYLMIPASRTEKFWLGVLYCLVAALLLGVVWFGAEAVIFEVANGRLKPGQTQYVPSLSFYGARHSRDGAMVYIVLYTFLLAMGVALLGSFYFRRGVYIRNVGLVLGLFIAFMLLYRFILQLQFSGLSVSAGLPFMGASVEGNNHWTPLFIPNWLMVAVYGGLLLMVWITARVRFNEIER